MTIVNRLAGCWRLPRKLLRKKRKPIARETVAEQEITPRETPWSSVLNVPSVASATEIKVAYKRLMWKYHPDRLEHLDPEEKALHEHRAKEITEAYRMAMRDCGPVN